MNVILSSAKLETINYKLQIFYEKEWILGNA